MTREQKVMVVLLVLAVLFVLLACNVSDPTGIGGVLNDLSEATPSLPY